MMSNGGARQSREERLQEMLDHYEITKLINVYCHGCDRLDEERMASVYAEDSWDHHGRNQCAGQELARRLMPQMAENMNMCSHLMGQTLINVNGDEAGAESYFLAVVRAPRPDGGETLNLLGGRYVDTLVRENDEWKIKNRIAVRDWSSSYPISDDWLDGHGHVRGLRSGDDPSFAVLGVTHSGIPAVDAATAAR